jgi:transcriptional regulator with XRE-family HTH domain
MPTDPSTTLGQELEDARQQAGLSLRDLAQLIELPHSRINRIVKDEVERPSPDTLVRLARTLNLSVARLFTLAGYPYPDLDDLLTTDYRLPQAAIAEIHQVISNHRGKGSH